MDINGNNILSGSATARNLMINAIDHTDWVSVQPGRNSGVVSGSNIIGLNASQIDGFINGSMGIDNRSLGWGMTFMHELHHTQVGGGLPDAPYNPGPVVTNMNTIRAELNAIGENYGQRVSYMGIKLGSNVYIPFDNNTHVLLNSGLIPGAMLQDKYIKY
ncbi:MAG: hypothetical protein LUH15_17230 [Tannerellaceae bacterium]|nr:hypothetical protein [Tannerellaceae bacterium]